MENIDKIFYINLEHRIDRNNQISKELQKLEIPSEKIERFPAIYHKVGAIGCGLSHIQILKIAQERGYKNIIILEDDFTSIIEKEGWEYLLGHVFSNNIDFNIILLSYNITCNKERTCFKTDAEFFRYINTPTSKEYDEYLDICIDVGTTSGYLVNQKFMETLEKNFTEAVYNLSKTGDDKKFAIDQYWKKLQDDKFLLFKNRFGVQRASFSDCAGLFIDPNNTY